MKYIKKTLSFFVKLNALAFGGLYLINRRIRFNACADHQLTKETGATYQWNDTDVYYEVLGNQEDAILLLHDTTPSASGQDMKELAKLLSEKYTVYLLDLPGCGRSDKPSINYTNYYYVQFLHAFIKDVIKKQVSIAAVGLSGSFAVTLTSIYKEETASLFLIDPWNLKKLSAVPDQKSYLVRLLLSVPVLGESIYNLIYTKQQVEAFLSNKMYFNPFLITKKNIDINHEAAHIGDGNGRFLRASLDGKYLNWNINRIIASLSTPITILYGEKSRDGALTAKQYREINPNIAIIAIGKADHALVLENADEVASHL